MASKMKQFTVLGDGNWGTTLAIILQRRGFRVHLWGPFSENIEAMKKEGLNQQYLPGVKLPKEIELFSVLSEAVKGSDIIVLAIPSKFIRSIILQLKEIKIAPEVAYLSAVKGIETNSLKRVSEIIEELLGDVPFAVLSGGTIANDIICGKPAKAVVASKDEKLARELAHVFKADNFETQFGTDVTGVEFGGCLKNVIALAKGVAKGVGGDSLAWEKVIKIGLAEAGKLAFSCGAKRETFNGPSWLDDLYITCQSEHSRNCLAGELFGQGKSLDQVAEEMKMVAEGIETAKAVLALAKKKKIKMPLVQTLNAIIFEGQSPKSILDLVAASDALE